MSTPRSGRRGRRHATLAFTALAALLAFAPQASAQAMSSSTVVEASPTAATVGERVVLTATVNCTGTAEGGLGVTFFDGSNLLATVDVDPNGFASLATSFITTGEHLITAAYNGTDSCSASNDETTVAVSDAPAPPAPPLGGLISFNNVGNGNNYENIANSYRNTTR
jgi:Bacterial Ig-like domain (group 3)